MSKSPVYIGAGSAELSVQAAVNIIQDGEDSATHLVTIADWVHLTDGTTVVDGITGVDSGKYSAKEYAQGTNASTGGSSKSWSQDTDGVNGAGANDRSAKAWSQGASMTGATLGGSSKDWAILAEDAPVDGTNFSALHWAAKAATTYDNFDDRYLGAHTTSEREVGVENIGKDHDGNALVDGAIYFDTTLNILKVWNLGTTTWDKAAPTALEQTQINTLTTGYDGTTSTTPGTNLNIVQVDKVADIVNAVEEVALIEANVTKVADIDSDVSDVADIDDKVTIVAGLGTNGADVTTVAGKATEIGRLGTADAVADMALLGTTDCVADMAILGTADIVADLAILGTADIVADMAILATTDIVADMAILGTADIVADMALLGTADCVADMALLATVDCIADMNTLATGDIVADLNTLATSDIVADLNTLATSDIVADLSIVADNIGNVSSFADLYQIDDFSPSAPTTDGGGNAVAEGDLAYDSTANRLKFYDGSAFVAMSSTTETTTAANNAAVAMSIALG
jgi:hypothetical protein